MNLIIRQMSQKAATSSKALRSRSEYRCCRASAMTEAVLHHDMLYCYSMMWIPLTAEYCCQALGRNNSARRVHESLLLSVLALKVLCHSSDPVMRQLGC